MVRLVCFSLFAAALALPQSVGPANGSLLVVGGGKLGPEVISRFLELAGGAEAPIVVIPTAQEDSGITDGWLEKSAFAKAGAKHLTRLHTRDRKVADSESFSVPLRAARGVWFEGGRQWRLVDSYLGTRTEREIRAVLARGG